MYAIIQTGGKQYRVEPNTVLSVEKIDAEQGAAVEINEVLMVRTENGLKVGAPYVEGVKVIAEVVKQTKAPKIIGFKYKPKKNERKRWGHRQRITVLRVKQIVGVAESGSTQPTPSASESADAPTE
ncbi:MAG: 50S ribosomal protein L21 [Fimbriimonadales bacterium]|nr:50S ribosomal protein L21 [Fimbriimonadales bacterium]